MQIGPYEVTGELGRGGMGVVYAVRHPQDPRPLALKVLLTQGERSGAATRFAREAAALAKVSHPHVARIVSVGEAPQGPFMVLERVAGETLEARLGRGPLEAREAARVLAEVASGLAALHAAGVVHRDVKPDNVMLRPDGSAVLLDLGVAHEADAETLTKTGQLVGTPAFMSPEQAVGHHREVDARTDVWGVGATLYAAVVGEPPFVRDSLLELVRAVIHDEPSWPREVPRELVVIGRRALTKPREERYPDVAALGRDLAAFAAGELGRAAERRRRLALGLTAAAGLLAVGAVVATAVGAGGRGEGRSSEARSGEERAGDEPSGTTDPASPDPESPRSLAEVERLKGAARIGGYAAWLRASRDHPELAAVRRRFVAAKLAAGPRRLGPAHPSSGAAWLGASRLVTARFQGDPGAERADLELASWDLAGSAPPVVLGGRSNVDRGARPVVGPGPGGRAALFATSGRTPFALVADGALRWLERPEAKTPWVRCAALSPSGRWLAVGYESTRSGRCSIEVYAWEALLGASSAAPPPVATADAGGAGLQDLTFLDEERLIVHTGWDERGLRVWTLAGGRLAPSGRALLPERVTCFALHPGRRWLAVGLLGTSALQLIDAATGAWVRQLGDPRVLGDLRGFVQEVGAPAHDSPIGGLMFTPDGSLLYSLAQPLDEAPEVKVWRTGPDPAGPALWLSASLDAGGDAPLAGALLSPDGRWLLAARREQPGSGEGWLEVWDVGVDPGPE